MVWVVMETSQGIRKDRRCLFESDSMLTHIDGALSNVPRET